MISSFPFLHFLSFTSLSQHPFFCLIFSLCLFPSFHCLCQYFSTLLHLCYAQSLKKIFSPRLFETHPDVRDTFTPFRGLPASELHYSSILKGVVCCCFPFFIIDILLLYNVNFLLINRVYLFFFSLLFLFRKYLFVLFV